MPSIEDSGYTIHYVDQKGFQAEVKTVLVLADEAESKKPVWVWADSLPVEVRDFVYSEAELIIKRKNL